MYKNWTLSDIQAVIDDIAETMNYPCDIPIFISKRAKKRLGAFYFHKYENKIMPLKFVFSEDLINGRYNEAVVREVIIHEYLHYFCDTKTGKSNKHNKVFKSMCRKVGISDKATLQVEKENDENKEKKRAYKIYCRQCGNLVGINKRKDAADRKIKGYISKCCKEKLVYIFDFV